MTGRAGPDIDIRPVFDTETESKDNKGNIEKEVATSEHKTASTPEPQTNEAAQNGFASVYQADEDESIAEYDRFDKADKTSEEAVDVNDINIAQGVTEIEVTGQTINVDGEEDTDAVTTEKDTDENDVIEDENDVIEVQGGYKEHKHSLKDHPNIRYMSRDMTKQTK